MKSGAEVFLFFFSLKRNTRTYSILTQKRPGRVEKAVPRLTEEPELPASVSMSGHIHEN